MICDRCGFEFDAMDQLGCSVLSCPKCGRIWFS